MNEKASRRACVKGGVPFASWLSLVPAAFCLLGLISPPVFAQGNLPVVRGHVNKGNYLLSRRQFQEAINEYEEALKLDPSNTVARNNIVEVHNNWAIFFYSQKKYGDALEQWQKALELDPGHRNARRNMALMKQNMAQQGITLSGAGGDSEAEPGADKKAGKTTAPGKPAATAASPPPGAGVPKEDPSTAASGAVLILTPGLRQSQPGKTSDSDSSVLPPEPALAAPPPAPSSSSFASPSAAAAGQSQASIFTPPPSATVSPPPSGKPSPASPLFPVTPEQFPLQPAARSQGAPIVQPAATSAVSPPQPAAATLEDQLSAIEAKIYGQKASDLTVLQRLEKLERDTAGLVRPGTIIERINYLKQSYGL